MGTWKCDDRPYEGEEQLHELANRLLLSTAPVELWHSLVMFDFGWTDGQDRMLLTGGMACRE